MKTFKRYILLLALTVLSLFSTAQVPILSMKPVASKDSTLYSYIPNTAAGDFDVLRNGINQRINQQLQLENVAVNVPQINWVDGVPVLKTQKAGNNLIARNVSFGHSDWTKTGSTIEGDASTAGATLWDAAASVFTSGTYAWERKNNNTITNVGNALQTTYVDHGDGSGVNLNYAADLSSDLVVGQMYKFTYTASYTGGSVGCGLRTYDGFNYSNVYLFTETPTVYSVYFIAQSTTGCVINGRGYSANNVSTIDNLSLTEVTGYPSPHATYDDKAYKLVESDVDEVHRVYINGVYDSNGDTDTWSIYAKAGERNYIYLSTYRDAQGFVSDSYFNLLTGETPTAITGSATITALSDGWYRCTLTGTSTAVSGDLKIYAYTSTNGTDALTGYDGDGTSGVYLFGAQLEESPHATSLMLNITEGLIDETSTASRIGDVTDVALPSGVTTITLTDSDGVESAGVVADPYVIPVSNLKKIVMI